MTFYSRQDRRVIWSNRGGDIDKDSGRCLNSNADDLNNAAVASSMMGTLKECKARCNRLGTCTGFGRARTAGDNAVSPCYFKGTNLARAEPSDEYALYLHPTRTPTCRLVVPSPSSFSAPAPPPPAPSLPAPPPPAPPPPAPPAPPTPPSNSFVGSFDAVVAGASAEGIRAATPAPESYAISRLTTVTNSLDIMKLVAGGFRALEAMGPGAGSSPDNMSSAMRSMIVGINNQLAALDPVLLTNMTDETKLAIANRVRSGSSSPLLTMADADNIWSGGELSAEESSAQDSSAQELINGFVAASQQQPASATSSNDSNPLSTGAWMGIGLGAAAVVLIIGVVIALWRHDRMRQNGK